MCSKRCPCYKSPNNEIIGVRLPDKNNTYEKYKNLPSGYLGLFGRKFDNHTWGKTLKEMVWDTDRKASFESFKECY